MRDSMLSLRSYFKGTDPQQHALDTLEQTIDSLMDRLHTTLTADEQVGLSTPTDGASCLDELSLCQKYH